MYITNLSVDGFEYYLTISFSSTQTVLQIIKSRNLTTQNAKYGLFSLFYGYETSLLVYNKRNNNLP